MKYTILALCVGLVVLCLVVAALHEKVETLKADVSALQIKASAFEALGHMYHKHWDKYNPQGDENDSTSN